MRMLEFWRCRKEMPTNCSCLGTTDVFTKKGVIKLSNQKIRVVDPRKEVEENIPGRENRVGTVCGNTQCF